MIPVDLLGHGTADAPHDPAEYAHLESSIERALPDERVDAIGFSLGAQLLLRVAAKTPERIGRLVVIGVGANVFRDDDTQRARRCVRTWRRADEHHRRGCLCSWLAPPGTIPSRSAACVRRPREPLTTDELARVSSPTLVIIGDKDFAGPPQPLVEALAERIARDAEGHRPLPHSERVCVHRRHARIRRGRRSDMGWKSKGKSDAGAGESLGAARKWRACTRAVTGACAHFSRGLSKSAFRGTHAVPRDRFSGP